MCPSDNRFLSCNTFSIILSLFSWDFINLTISSPWISFLNPQYIPLFIFLSSVSFIGFLSLIEAFLYSSNSSRALGNEGLFLLIKVFLYSIPPWDCSSTIVCLFPCVHSLLSCLGCGGYTMVDFLSPLAVKPRPLAGSLHYLVGFHGTLLLLLFISLTVRKVSKKDGS